MIQTLKDNPKSVISISTIVAVLGLFVAVWKVDDRYAKAGDIQDLKTNQSAVMQKLDKHLDFEKQQAIYDLEDKIEDIDREVGNGTATAEDKARRDKYIRRLKALYGIQ